MICRAHAAVIGRDNPIHRRAGTGSDLCHVKLPEVTLWSSVIEPRCKVSAMLFNP